jgi:hypothetical protein
VRGVWSRRVKACRRGGEPVTSWAPRPCALVEASRCSLHAPCCAAEDALHLPHLNLPLRLAGRHGRCRELGGIDGGSEEARHVQSGGQAAGAGAGAGGKGGHSAAAGAGQGAGSACSSGRSGQPPAGHPAAAAAAVKRNAVFVSSGTQHRLRAGIRCARIPVSGHLVHRGAPRSLQSADLTCFLKALSDRGWRWAVAQCNA